MRKNPLQGAVDLAGLYGGVGPIGTMIKSIPAASTALLRKATQFESNFAAKRAEALTAEQAAKEQSMQAAAAKINQPETPVAGPVQPPVSQPPAPVTQAPTVMPAIPEVIPPAPVTQAPIKTTVKQTPPIQPVQPTNLPSTQLKTQLGELDKQISSLHEENVGKVTPDTPEGIAYRDQLDAMAKKYGEIEQQFKEAQKAEKEAEKKAKKEAKKNMPKDVSQMMTQPTTLGNIPKQFEYGINEHPGRVVAELKEKGQWEHQGHKYNLEHLEHGQKRIQVRDSKGAVVYEKYYD
jgi:hypothetical protein